MCWIIIIQSVIDYIDEGGPIDYNGVEKFLSPGDWDVGKEPDLRGDTCFLLTACGNLGKFPNIAEPEDPHL